MESIENIASVIVARGVAVYLVLTTKKKGESSGIADIYISEGIALDFCLGAGTDASMLGYLSYLTSLGTLIGLLAGMRAKG